MLSVCVARQPGRLRRALAIGAALAALSAPSPGVAQDMSLSDALSRVAIGDPAVAANAARLQVADAAITQADVRPRDVTYSMEQVAALLEAAWGRPERRDRKSTRLNSSH